MTEVSQNDATVMAHVIAKSVSKFADFMVELAESLHKDRGLEYVPAKSTKLSKKRKSPVDSNAPNKAKTAYFVFCDVMRDQAKASGEPVPQATKLGELWGALKDEEKAEYGRMAKELHSKEVAKREDDDDEEDDVAPPS